jgi:hypothetical protein
MRVLGLVAAVVVLGVLSPAAAREDNFQRPSKEAEDAFVAYAGALGSHAYFMGACEAFHDPKSVAAAVASLMGVGEPEDGPIMREVRAVWTQQYGEGRRDAGRFTKEQCRKFIAEGDAEIEQLRRQLPR